MTKGRRLLRIYIQCFPHLGATYRRPQCGFLITHLWALRIAVPRAFLFNPDMSAKHAGLAPTLLAGLFKVHQG